MRTTRSFKEQTLTDPTLMYFQHTAPTAVGFSPQTMVLHCFCQYPLHRFFSLKFIPSLHNARSCQVETKPIRRVTWDAPRAFSSSSPAPKRVTSTESWELGRPPKGRWRFLWISTSRSNMFKTQPRNPANCGVLVLHQLRKKTSHLFSLGVTN